MKWMRAVFVGPKTSDLTIYNLDGYWTMGVNGKRWTYYRLGSLSHNVPVLGNKNQYELAKAKFTSHLESQCPIPILTAANPIQSGQTT